jgi:hypothetical protein
MLPSFDNSHELIVHFSVSKLYEESIESTKLQILQSESQLCRSNRHELEGDWDESLIESDPQLRYYAFESHETMN